jgi:hypothetical protein
MPEGFDASAFLNQTVDGPMSTSIPAVPEGEYKMIVSSDGDIAEWFSTANWNDKNTGEAKSVPTVTIPVEIVDDALRAKLGREKVTCRIKMFLDMKDGKLDTSEGKNVRLGALRAAVGQNVPGWNFAQLKGAGPFIGRVTQTSDKKDPEIKYSEVTRVSKLA